eukprot:347773-Chlamydomonas_euryale.AAC.1
MSARVGPCLEAMMSPSWCRWPPVVGTSRCAPAPPRGPRHCPASPGSCGNRRSKPSACRRQLMPPRCPGSGTSGRTTRA